MQQAGAKIINTNGYTCPGMRELDYLARWILFLVYFSISIYLMSLLHDRRECFVQSTYRQEFVANMVSNPLMTSANVMKDAPLSKLEIAYYNVEKKPQEVMNIIAFPTGIQNSSLSAAFLTVLPEPQTILAAGETIPLSKKTDNSYYWNQMQGVYGYNVPQSADERQYILDSMLSATSGGPKMAHPGTQLPNMYRYVSWRFPL